MTNPRTPLVSFVLFTFNQQQFVREAVLSVLAQEYSPLEIIISDDCSTDNTYNIIQDVVATYSGPKRVILNRNTRNLGTARHINKIFGSISGEFCILGAGDDISLSNRTSHSVEVWNILGRVSCSIFTNAQVIDEQGVPQGAYYEMPAGAKTINDFVASGDCWLGGFSHACTKDLYDRYGPIVENTFQEDGAFAFRALLNSGVHYSPAITVLYRRHGANTYNPFVYSKLKNLYRSELALYRGQMADLLNHKNITETQRVAVERILSRKIIRSRAVLAVPGLLAAIFFRNTARRQLLSCYRKSRSGIFRFVAKFIEIVS